MLRTQRRIPDPSSEPRSSPVSMMVPALDQSQQVLAKDFKHHADMDTVRPLVFKRVQQTDDMLPTGVGWFRLHDSVEELDLIDRGFGVVCGRPNDLQRNVFSGRGIS